MGLEQTKRVIKLRILEIEDKLMDLIEISFKYEDIQKEIEYLENLIN